MKKSSFFLICFCIMANMVFASSGRLVQKPLFVGFKEFDYFVKAKVISMDKELDSLNNTTVNISLLVLNRFGCETEDTISISPVKFNLEENTFDGFVDIHMDFKIESIYYIGLKTEGEDKYTLSPYIIYNKVLVKDDYLKYRIFTKLDYLFAYRLGYFSTFLSYTLYGRTMKVEDFEKKLNRRLKKS
jgi:hypothetical protein